jgi:hypothetical protein
METVLVFVLIPAGVYGGVALLTLWPKFSRPPRYRPGQEWTYTPQWWTAHGTAEHGATVETPAGSTVAGGARGTW